MIRVLLVDDHRLVRAGLASLIESVHELHIVGAVADGAEAVRVAAELHPDVVLMDLSMPTMDGVEATRRIVAADPTMQILILTSFSDGARVREAIEAGAVGYLLKDSEPQDLIAGIRAVVRGESPLDPRVARAMLTRAEPTTATEPTTAAAGDSAADSPAAGRPAVDSSAGAATSRAAAAAAAGGELTGREREVLELISQGLPNKRIARALGISEGTVKAHVGSIFLRIGVTDRTSAALWFREHGHRTTTVSKSSR